MRTLVWSVCREVKLRPDDPFLILAASAESQWGGAGGKAHSKFHWLIHHNPGMTSHDNSCGKCPLKGHSFEFTYGEVPLNWVHLDVHDNSITPEKRIQPSTFMIYERRQKAITDFQIQSPPKSILSYYFKWNLIPAAVSRVLDTSLNRATSLILEYCLCLGGSGRPFRLPEKGTEKEPKSGLWPSMYI